MGLMDGDEFDAAGRVPEDVLRLAEAFVFASPEPVTERALASLLPEGANAYLVLEALQARCARRGVVLAEVGGGWQFRTAPDLAPRLRAALAPPKRLPRAAVEVLAMIALHQPITRGEVGRARGVSVGQATMDLLLGAGLIKPCGRELTPGRPTLWATTPRFLVQYGLRSLWELPGAGLPRSDAAAEAGEGGQAPVLEADSYLDLDAIEATGGPDEG